MIMLKIGVSAGALWFVFSRYSTTDLLSVWQHVNCFWLMAAAAICVAHILSLGLRWQAVHRLVVGTVLPSGLMFANLGRSLVAGQLLPAIVGMDTLRIAGLARPFGLVNATRSVAMDRIVGFCGLVILEAVSLPAVASVIHDWRMIALLAVMCAVPAALVLTVASGTGPLRSLPFGQRFFEYAGRDLRQALLSVAGARCMGLSVFSHVTSVILFATLARAIDATSSIRLCCLFFPSVLLVSSVPISLGGWGIREAAVALAFSSVGSDPAASTASILFGLSTPVSGLFALAFGAVSRLRGISAEPPPSDLPFIR